MRQDVMPEGAKSPWCSLSDGGVKPKQLRDRDSDGMPDWWEKENGLDLRNGTDGNACTLSHEGYTNLEVYLNSLVQ